MRVRRLLVFALLGFVLHASASEQFAFWPGKGVKAARGFQSLQEHPCGTVAYAKVNALPPVGRGPLLPELVVELDAKRQVVRRWAMPVDFTPEAVRGEELLVAFGESKFWVKPSGAFTQAGAGDLPPQGEQVACDLKAVFGNSAYVQCRAVRDAISGKERVIGYQGACT